MSLPATNVWEVRTTGADTNGGGFDPTATGTDYSQQDSPHASGTDLASTNGTSGSPSVTSASHTFDSTDVGNTIQITAGTSWTTGFYKIVSVTSGAATLDRACGSAATLSSGTWAEGGGLATINKATNTAAVNGNTIYVKSGTYTITSTITLPNSIALSLIGYTTTRGDNGMPTVTSATNSVVLFTIGSATGGYALTNFALTHTAATRGDGFNTNGSFNTFGPLAISNISINGCNVGVNMQGTNNNAVLQVSNALIENCKSHGIANGAASTGIFWSEIHDNTGDGININNGRTQAGTITVENVILYKNGGAGYNCAMAVPSNPQCFTNVTSHTNTGDGFKINPSSGASWVVFSSNIMVSNGGYGINIASGTLTTSTVGMNNAAYNNTSGVGHSFLAGTGWYVTLTGDPCNSPSGGDFSLNNNSGAGAACRGAGFPGVLISGGTGYADIGALQHLDSGGGSTIVVGGTGMGTYVAM